MGLYGYDVDVQRSDTLSAETLSNIESGKWTKGNVDPSDGFAEWEVKAIEDKRGNENTDAYIFIGHYNQNSPGTMGLHYGGTDIMSVFTAGPEEVIVGDTIPENTNARTDDRLEARETVLHELGHEFDMGEADDYCTGYACAIAPDKEVYSGNKGAKLDSNYPPDKTPEIVDVYKPSKNRWEEERKWSIMGKGGMSLRYHFSRPTNGEYVAYSIEELFTATD